MVKLDDSLELLLPGADPGLAGRARDLVRFLRLLTADARSEPAGRVGLDLERARGEFEGGVRRQLRQSLVALLQAHLAQAVGPDSFAWFGVPERELAAAWSQIEEARAEHSWMPAVPSPGESSVSVAGRALAAAQRLDPGAPEWELWAARLLRAESGARAAEDAFRAGLERCMGTDAAPECTAGWLAGLCECLLDRGAPREARACLQEARERVLADPRLCQLLGWTRLLLGDAQGAKGLLASRRAPEVHLPGPLHELRSRCPDWAGLLPQRFSAREEPHSGPARAVARRAHFGASVCVAIGLDARGVCIVRGAEVAPALAARAATWLSSILSRPEEAGTPEQRLLREHDLVVVHAPDEACANGTLGGEQTLALALVPVLASQGELLGWFHLEFEHHLLPRSGALLQWARDAWPWLAEAQPREQVATTARHSTVRADPRAECLLRLIEDLGLRAICSRWSGLSVRGGVLELVAEDGDGGSSRSPRHIPRALLQRVLLGGGHVVLDTGDASLGLHPSTRSVLALALRWGERTSGVLIVESNRERGFAGIEPGISSERVAGAALALDVECFSASHRELHGAEVWFDAARADFRVFAERLQRAAPSPSPVLLSGPPGSGKTVLARWIHHLSSRSGLPLVETHAARLTGPDSWNACVQRAGEGTLLVEDIDRLDPLAQHPLFEWMERVLRADCGTDRPRLLATTSEDLAASVQPGGLGLALARELQHVSFRVPALATRRQEIVHLGKHFLSRLASLERRRVPELEDEAWGLLWRQPWPGNLRELSAFLHRVVLFATGTSVGAAQLEEISARSGQPILRRIASRHPSRADLQGALACTLLGTGRVNKTRAAAYLGWDPDTLVARMADLGIETQAPESPPAWTPPVGSARGGGTEDDAPPIVAGLG